MESSSSETELPVSISNPNPNIFLRNNTSKKKKKKKNQQHQTLREEESWSRKTKKGGSGVTLEGYLDAVDGGDQGSDAGGLVGRTKSLTDDDLVELKGCLDLGFGFSYEEIPELCNTLPALELCYSMSQRFLDEQQRLPDSSSEDSVSTITTTSSSSSSSSSLVANWKISSPGDDPDEVKARLKYWAQAVACTVRLCS